MGLWLNLKSDYISCSLNFVSIHYCFIFFSGKIGNADKPWRCNFVPGPAVLQADEWARHKSCVTQNGTEGIPALPRPESSALSSPAMNLGPVQNPSSKHDSCSPAAFSSPITYVTSSFVQNLSGTRHTEKTVSECSSQLVRLCVWAGIAHGTQNSIRAQLYWNPVGFTEELKPGKKIEEWGLV